MKGQGAGWTSLAGIAMLAVFIGLCFMLFGHTLSFGYFVFDDGGHIFANPRLNPVTWAHLGWIWTHSLMPVSYSIWAAIAALWGTAHALPFRVFALILHAMNATLVALWCHELVRRVQPESGGARRRAQLAAFLGGLLFLVHPVHVEAIAWVSATKDLLSSFFLLLSLLLHLRRREAKEERIYQWLAYFFLLAAGLSKFSGFAGLFLMVWLDRALYRREWSRLVREYSAWFVAGAAALWLHHRLVPLDGMELVTPLQWRIPVALSALANFSWKLILPIENYFDYGKTPGALLMELRQSPATALPACLVSGGLVALLIPAMRHARGRIFHFSFGFFLLSLLPFLGLVPFVFQDVSTVADRYLYLPAAGLSLIIAFGLARLEGARKKVALVAMLLVCSGLAVKAYHQSELWQDSVTVLQYSVRQNPDGRAAQLGLSQALANKSDGPGAIQHYYFGNFNQLGGP